MTDMDDATGVTGLSFSHFNYPEYEAWQREQYRFMYLCIVGFQTLIDLLYFSLLHATYAF